MVRSNCILNRSSGSSKLIVEKDGSLWDFRVDRSVDEDHVGHKLYVFDFIIVLCDVSIKGGC